VHQAFNGFSERQRDGSRFVSRTVGNLGHAVALFNRPIHPSEHVLIDVHQLQPLVEPQLGQAWHEPARIICTPHCMHMGASL
jgi:hypothetical protein